MPIVKHSARHDLIFLIISGIFFTSLLFSVYILSISMFLIGALAILDFDPISGRPTIRKDFSKKAAEFVDHPSWWVVMLPFFIILYGGLYSDSTYVWLERLRIKIPFLLFPFAMYLLPPLRRRTYLLLHLLFILLVTLSTLAPLWQILSSFQEVMEGLRKGQPVSTPISHIRYSLMIALAAVASGLLVREKELPKWISPPLLWSVFIYLSLILHLLAVRSGLAAWYFACLLLVIKSLIKQKKYLLLSLFVVILASLPAIAYQLIPSLKQRIDYMVEDIKHYHHKEWNAYSDGERMLSIAAGWELAKKNPIWGVGPADLKMEMRKYFYKHFDKDTFIMPHNQFISMLAGSGLIGLILFISALLIPLFHKRHYREPLFATSQFIIILSLFVENTLETSVGVAFYLYFLLIGLNYLRRHDHS